MKDVGYLREDDGSMVGLRGIVLIVYNMKKHGGLVEVGREGRGVRPAYHDRDRVRGEGKEGSKG